MLTRILGHTPPTAIGHKLNTVIPGYQTIHGVGQLSIMAGGIMMIIMAGNGYRGTIGHLHGLAGATAVVIMDGHRWMQVYLSAYQ